MYRWSPCDGAGTLLLTIVALVLAGIGRLLRFLGR